MIATHQKLNGLDDAILSIDIKDITTTQENYKEHRRCKKMICQNR